MPEKIEVLTVEQLKLHCDINEAGCWIWKHSVRGQMGYAQLNGEAMGWGWRRQVGGHQLAYFFKTGEPPPEGYVVMHSCHTPRCCNPDHVELGTYSSNNLDGWRTGDKEYRRQAARSRMIEDIDGAYARGREIGMPRGLIAMNGEKK
jgi:hypothetical protein